MPKTKYFYTTYLREDEAQLPLPTEENARTIAQYMGVTPEEVNRKFIEAPDDTICFGSYCFERNPVEPDFPIYELYEVWDPPARLSETAAHALYKHLLTEHPEALSRENDTRLIFETALTVSNTDSNDKTTVQEILDNPLKYGTGKERGVTHIPEEGYIVYEKNWEDA